MKAAGFSRTAFASLWGRASQVTGTDLTIADHYDSFLRFGLTAAGKTDLIEYLKSL